MNAQTSVRKDSENLAIIERLKPKHSAEMNKLIRYETELERGERDVEELLVQLEQEWGTRDLDKVREIIRQNHANNSQKVNQWVADLTAVTDELAALENKG